MAKEYDALFKELLTRRPADWLAVCGFASAGPVEVIDSDVSAATAAADKVLRVGTGPAAWLLHLKFQSSKDADLPKRLLQYAALLHARHDLPVVTTVVVLRRSANLRAYNGRYTIQVPGFGVALDMRYHVIRVWQLPREPLLTGPIGVAPLAVLTDETAEEMLTTWERIGQRVAAEVPEPEQRLYLSMTDRLAVLRHSGRALRELYGRLRPMGRPIWEQVYDELLGPEYYQRGLDAGQLKAKREVLLELGTQKFGSPAAADAEALSRVQDLAVLDRALKRLSTAADWADLLGDAAP